jgi:hypothetical protein
VRMRAEAGCLTSLPSPSCASFRLHGKPRLPDPGTRVVVLHHYVRPITLRHDFAPK